MTSISSPTVVLASTSRYRAQLLRRLLSGFECVASGIDETPLQGEAPAALSLRLADAKAAAIAMTDNTIVIGSDQVAEFAGQPLGKPGSRAANIRQLLEFSGQTVIFHTAVVVRHENRLLRHSNQTVACFHELDEALVSNYVDFDEAWDCAGGFKAESAAPVLLSELRSDDPTGIIGLPLNWLAAALRQCGVALLTGK